MELEAIGKHIVDSAIAVHRALGPGLLERSPDQKRHQTHGLQIVKIKPQRRKEHK